MPAPETLAGRYELRGLLGHGGMGDVYDGWDLRLGRPVAVKVLRSDLAAAADIRLRFESEARTAATINHPNVVAVYDSGEDGGRPFIVMERLPGRTLADEIAEAPVSPDRVRVVLADVLSALGAAHAAGVLHRDIKPGNVLFSTAGAVKVTDFGIAKTAESNQTATGEVLGTVAYLSPDRIEGKPAGVTDDLYAVGVMGYEMVAGFRPFAGDNILSVARAILQHDATPLRALSPSADPMLVGTIERAMAPDPVARFPDAESMRRALLVQPMHPPAAPPMPAAVPPATRAFTSPIPPSAAYAAQAAPAPASRSRRRPLVAAAIVAAAIVAVVAGLLAVSLGSDSSDAPATTPSTTTSSAPQLAPGPEPVTTATVPTTTTTAAAPAPREPAPPVVEVPPDTGNEKQKEKEKEKEPGNGNGEKKNDN
ncbi:serine/threonine-protein kinase [Williamsia muralis]|uniref:non-specific serine/threonine protein kinase n=1 Tax=Williamsia marianensis TaxID=85044 RepID=A0ABU4ERJ9_WILMA|nr:serine/threonine-protein kinase [Williamsia muralis]MDV7133259.1 serine/threonine-protein kinase [Williamsia muralis]